MSTLTRAARGTKRVALLITLILALPACNRAELSGPPELRVGRDQCLLCGMLIAEDRYCAAMLVDRAGRREHVLFDDLGCLADFENDGTPDVTPIERFARDADARAWIVAADALYVLGSNQTLRTPMGSGLVAYRSRTDAERSAQEHHGQVLSYDQMLVARRAWMEERYGPRPDPD